MLVAPAAAAAFQTVPLWGSHGCDTVLVFTYQLMYALRVRPHPLCAPLCGTAATFQVQKWFSGRADLGRFQISVTIRSAVLGRRCPTEPSMLPTEHLRPAFPLVTPPAVRGLGFADGTASSSPTEFLRDAVLPTVRGRKTGTDSLCCRCRRAPVTRCGFQIASSGLLSPEWFFCVKNAPRGDVSKVCDRLLSTAGATRTECLVASCWRGLAADALRCWSASRHSVRTTSRGRT